VCLSIAFVETLLSFSSLPIPSDPRVPNASLCQAIADAWMSSTEASGIVSPDGNRKPESSVENGNQNSPFVSGSDNGIVDIHLRRP
jgi:hypothetical protein